MRDSYRDLLEKVSEELFRVLQVTAKEVVMCRFLADLWEPEGAHRCGNRNIERGTNRK